VIKMTEIPRHVQLGYQFGLLKEDFSLENYLIYAVDNNDGYETVVLHGQQGSGKSNRALQYCSWIKKHNFIKKHGLPPTERQLWNEVLSSIVFSPAEFVKTLKEIPEGEKLDVLVWDDIQLNYTSSTFKTDVKQYSAIDSMFAVIRTKVAVVIITIPNITRLPKNVKDNITIEAFIGKNRLEQIRKIFRLPGTQDIDSNTFKPIIEEPEIFDLYNIPIKYWMEYEKMRIKIADDALSALESVTDMNEKEEWVTVWEVSQNVKLSPNSIQQMGSRKVIPVKVIDGKLSMPKSFLPEFYKRFGDKPLDT